MSGDRYWYSTHGAGPWTSGWCFGDTPELAFTAALATIESDKRRGWFRGTLKAGSRLSLQLRNNDSCPNFAVDYLATQGPSGLVWTETDRFDSRAA